MTCPPTPASPISPITFFSSSRQQAFDHQGAVSRNRIQVSSPIPTRSYADSGSAKNVHVTVVEFHRRKEVQPMRFQPCVNYPFKLPSPSCFHLSRVSVPHRVLSSSPPSDYLKFSSDYSHSVVGGAGSARGMRSASELRDLMDTLQRKKIALENSLRANGSANPSYFSVTQVRPPTPSTSIRCCGCDPAPLCRAGCQKCDSFCRFKNVVGCAALILDHNKKKKRY